MKLWRFLFIVLALIVAIFAAFNFSRSRSVDGRSGVVNKEAWQRMASPGALSQGHAFLEHNCAACHTPVKGVQAANCIVCHANNQTLLQRQPTFFHADVSSCSECHREHRGVHERPTLMDHAALSRVGLRQLKSNPDPETEDRLASAHFLRWINEQEGHATSGQGSAYLTAEERILNCAACHGNKDRHFGLFGQDCSQCHATAKWIIPEFRHPPTTSLDCAQCHQAPPSHYMMHFQMIDQKVCNQPNAKVNQCFLCHQTTAWNDLKGIGFYKHH